MEEAKQWYTAAHGASSNLSVRVLCRKGHYQLLVPNARVAWLETHYGSRLDKSDAQPTKRPRSSRADTSPTAAPGAGAISSPDPRPRSAPRRSLAAAAHANVPDGNDGYMSSDDVAGPAVGAPQQQAMRSDVDDDSDGPISVIDVSPRHGPPGLSDGARRRRPATTAAQNTAPSRQ